MRRVLCGDTTPLTSEDYKSFNLLRGQLTADGGSQLRLSASTPEDLNGEGAWRTAERLVERSRHRD